MIEVSDELAEVTRRATTLLSQIAYGPTDLIRAALEPTPEDYAAVFVGDAATQAREFYAGFWANPPTSLVRVVAPQIRIVALRAQDIVQTQEFPGGYRKVAHMLAPDHIWVRWKFIGNGGADVLAYDGLVARGERWAWFPKPWRMLRSDDTDAGN